jgi:D-alanyl-D-alanine carboxypeptidase
MVTAKIESVLSKSARKTKTLQFAMHVPSLGIHYNYSNTVPHQKFHSASVGKLMTATLIFIAIEQGKLSLDTKINTILLSSILDRLFVFKGHDYQDDITVKHLLGHTSGINDYFESKTVDGSLFIDEVLQRPNIFWTPKELIDFTRNRQKAVAHPDNLFFYSDTGYVLLGLLLEAVFQMPFHQLLHTYIFKPAGMINTKLCFYSDDFHPPDLAPMYVQGMDVHLFRSLSCDFSGGGLSTTTEDLLKFLIHFQNHIFIHRHSIEQMATFSFKYRQGLYYGLGMMQVRFVEFFFLLGKLPKLQGHLGVTGVHAWYDPHTQASFVLNVGNTRHMVMSFRLLIRIVQMVYQAMRQKSNHRK